MIRQHDAAGTDPQRFGRRCDVADQDGRRRTGDAGDVVMFRQPEAPVAQCFDMAGEIGAVAEAVRDRAAFHDG